MPAAFWIHVVMVFFQADRLRAARQVERNFRSSLLLTFDKGGSSRAARKAINLRQTKAGALVDVLSRKKGIEDLGQNARRNTLAII